MALTQPLALELLYATDVALNKQTDRLIAENFRTKKLN